MMLVGLRGVGKTVLLDQMMKDAEATGVVAIRIEAPEGKSLPAALAPRLRLGLLKLSHMEKARLRRTKQLQLLTKVFFASGSTD